MQRLRALSLFALLFTLGACEPSDLGKDCTPDAADAGAGMDGSVEDEATVFPATVRKDARCESFQCVSTQVRRNYCSEECNSDRNCPEGFACTQLQPVGPLANVKFCLLAKPCRQGVAADCPRDTMECRRIETSVADAPEFYCDLKAAQ